MNPAQNLPLRDIHLPDAVSWWPLAPGWWILLVLFVLFIVAAYLLIKRITKPVIKKSAKAKWQRLKEDYASHRDAQKLMQQLSVLMRRIGISYLPRSEAAGITGTIWYQQLNDLVRGAPLSDESIALLVRAPYQPDVDISESEIGRLLNDVEQWINALAREVAHD